MSIINSVRLFGNSLTKFLFLLVNNNKAIFPAICVLFLVSLFILFPFLRTSIWYDESWRIMKLIDTNFLRSINIEYSPTPLLFDVFTKIFLLLISSKEIGFRLANTLCGLIAVSVVTLYFYKKYKSLPISILLYLLLLFNPWYFVYLMEGKQFMFEALGFTLNLIILVESVESKNFRLMKYLLFLPFFGMSIFFLAFSNFTTILYLGIKTKISSWKLTVLEMLLVVSYGISLFYMYLNKSAQSVNVVTDFFKEQFIQLTFISVVTAYKGLIDMVANPTIKVMPESPLFYSLNFLVLVSLVIFGLYLFIKNKAILIADLTLFFLTITFVSYLKLWPLGESRVNVFIVPSIFLLIFHSIGYFYYHNKSKLGVIIVISLLILPLSNATTTLKKFAISPQWYRHYYLHNQTPVISRWGDGMKECVNYIKGKMSGNNMIIVLHPLAEPLFSFEYYFNSDVDLSNKVVILRDSIEPEKIRDYTYLLDKLAGKKRVFILAMLGTMPKDVHDLDGRIIRTGYASQSVKACESAVTVWEYAPIVSGIEYVK